MSYHARCMLSQIAIPSQSIGLPPTTTDVPIEMLLAINAAFKICELKIAYFFFISL